MSLRQRFIFFVLVLGIAPVVVAQSAPLDKQRMTQVIQNYVDNKSFMGDVLVAEGDHVVLKAAYGYADLDWSIGNTTDTKFRIGSLTKQFTAAAILLLQERGKLRVNEPIKTYLPDVPAAWSKVTVDNLLTHTSGIPNFTGSPDFSVYKLQSHTPKKVLPWFGASRSTSSRARNYTTATQITFFWAKLGSGSGMPYAGFLRQNIFIPVGMTETGVDVDSAILPERAQGYDSTPNGFRRADAISMTGPFSAGFLYSTVGDLLKWEWALLADRIISTASLRSMTTPGLGDYGMGLFIHTANGRQIITHDGAIEGFESSLNYYPERQLTIVVLGNIRTDAPQRIAAQLGKVAFGETVVLNSDRKVIEVKPSVLAKYVGHYSAPLSPPRSVWKPVT